MPARVSCILIHEWLHALFQAGPSVFNKSVLGVMQNPEAILEFWAHIRQLKEYKSFAADPLPTFVNLIPIIMHFDGAEIHKGREWHVWAWRSAWATGSELDIKFVFAAVPAVFVKSKLHQDLMHTAVTKLLAWDLLQCEAGTFPDRDFAGAPWSEWYRQQRAGTQICGGEFRACLFGVLADHKARKEANLFRRSHLGNLICPQCLATKAGLTASEFSMLDVSSTALWRSTILSHETYMATEGLSPWRFVKHWNLHMSWVDLMHTVHLGFLQDMLACSIRAWHECNLLPGGGTIAFQLKLFWQAFCQWCRARGSATPKGKLTPAGLSFGKVEYPCLTTNFKAITNRQLLAFMSEFAVERTSEIPGMDLITTALWSLDKCLELWSGAGLVLAPGTAEACHSLGSQCVQAYLKLSVTAHQAGQLRWNPRPKVHYFLHLLDWMRATRLNPTKTASAFSDEAYLGKFKKVGQKTRGSSNLVHRTLQRLLIGVKLRWKGDGLG
jgi:hypothetical protein